MPRPSQYTPRLASSKLDAVLRVLSFIFNERAKKKCTKTLPQHFLLLFLFSVLFLYREGCVAGRQEGREGTGAWHGGKRICYILFWRWFYISQQQLTFHWQAWFASCWPGGGSREQGEELGVGHGRGTSAADGAGDGYVCAARD